MQIVEDVIDDCECPYCGADWCAESHYHCPNCGKECSMMGHVDFTSRQYTCEHKQGPWNEEEDADNGPSVRYAVVAPNA